MPGLSVLAGVKIEYTLLSGTGEVRKDVKIEWILIYFYRCKCKSRYYFYILGKEKGKMANGAKLAYVRVSTIEQNEARQVEALEKHGIDKWYIEKVSGKNLDRPKLRELLEYAREGDTVLIHDLSRISRSLSDLLLLLKDFDRRGISLVSLHESIDTRTPIGKLTLSIIGAINEFERANLLERQREGIAIAKREGKYRGRKRVQLNDMEDVYQQYVTRQKSKAELAREHGISRPTLDRLLREYEREKIKKEQRTE